MRQFIQSIFKTMEDHWEVIKQNGIPAASIRDQLPGRTLPPGGPTGTGYPPADESVTTGKLADDAVTFAKFQNITTDRLVGRDTAGTGDAEQLTVGGGVEFTGSGGIQRSALTGDVTASAGSGSTTLANSGVSAATYGDSTHVPQIAVDAKGRITSASNVSISGAGSSLTVEEVDGSPTDSAVTKIKFPNGTLSIASHEVTYTPVATGSTPAHTYYDHLAALLEPDAIEPLLFDTFTYTVGSGDTKYVLASVGTQLNGAGHWEVRDPRRALPLRDATMTGLYSISCAITLDPTLATYADSWTTYHDRLLAIATLPTRYIGVPTSGARYPFLLGAYGGIVTGITGYDVTWIILRCMTQTIGINLAHEINDIDEQRTGHGLLLPLNKTVVSGVETGVGSGGSGGVSFILCPSTWSAIADPLAPYDFRDDFMGSSLDTSTVWTRAQSTAGNVEIDTTYQWCKVKGNGGWNANGLHTQSGFARGSGGTVMLIDVFTPDDTAGGIMVGWNDGGGQDYTNMAHGVNFGSGSFIIYESGVSRGTVGGSHSASGIYRFRLTLTSTGCTYEIQGGVEYDPIGGATWTDITPGTTSSAVTTLYPGATAYEGTNYISDVRVY